MPSQKPPESQGVRLLRQLSLQGKRIFNMQDVTAAAITENIPHNQLKKILSNFSNSR